jgi:hypothetical protein
MKLPGPRMLTEKVNKTYWDGSNPYTITNATQLSKPNTWICNNNIEPGLFQNSGSKVKKSRLQLNTVVKLSKL